MFDFTYRLKRLSERCYAFLEPHGLSNVGVVNTGSGTLLIDSTIHPDLMRGILDRLSRRRWPEVTRLIYTHFHKDHTFGSHALHDRVEVISHGLCADYLERHVGDWLGEETYGGLDLALKKPTSVFKGDDHRLEGVSPDVYILKTGGHSHDSCLVYVESESCLYSGDIVFNGIPLYTAHYSCLNHFGRVSEWIAALKTVLDLKPKVIVPGHGGIASLRDVRRLLRFFEYYAAVVENGVRHGKSLSEIWRGTLSRRDFIRKDHEPEIYLFMTMGYYDELKGAPSLFQK